MQVALVQAGEVAQVLHDLLDPPQPVARAGQHLLHVAQGVVQVHLLAQLRDPPHQLRGLFLQRTVRLPVQLQHLGQRLQVALEHGHVVDHERQRVVDLVRHARHHLPEAGELLVLHEVALGLLELPQRLALAGHRLLQQPVLVLQLLLGELALGDVPEDPLHADDPLARPVDRRLHHLHVQALARRRHVLLDRIEDPAALDDAAVVLAVALGQVVGKQVKVRLAQQLIEGHAEHLAIVAVAEGDAALEVLAEDVLRQRLHQRVVNGLGLAQGFFHPHALLVEAAQAGGVPPDEGDEDDDVGQREQRHQERGAVEVLALPLKRQDAHQQRDEHRRGQQAAGDHAAGGGAEQRRQRLAVGAGAQDPQT